MPDTPDPIMIFAAGFGTRMRPLTDRMPKPLIEVAGTPLLDHALNLVKEERLTPVVNAHYLAEQIVTHLESSDIRVCIEEPDILDTGGGLRNAELGPGPVFTLNSDAVWKGPNPLAALRAHWRPEEMDALMMLVPLGRTVGYSRDGDFACDAAGRLTFKTGGAVFTGAQILKTELLEETSSTVFSLRVIWERLAERKRLFGVEYPGYWADVGTPAGIELAEKMLADV